MKAVLEHPGTELLTSEEVLDRLMAEPGLRMFAATCVLPAVRRGTEVRFRRCDLDAWIEQEVSALAFQRAGFPVPGGR